jgi:hypothetical protein
MSELFGFDLEYEEGTLISLKRVWGQAKGWMDD